MKGRNLLLPLEPGSWHASLKRLLVELEGTAGAQIHILYVLTPSEWGFLAREEYDTEEKLLALHGAMDEGYTEGLLKTFKRLKEIARELALLGFKTKVVLIPGELDEVIADYCQKHKISLVVLSISRSSLSVFRVSKIVDILKAVEQPVLIAKG
jgi:nucleotide-binding universal stress UspA family protein